MGMFCTKCGAKNPEDATFCYKCGNTLYVEKTKP
ncbi:zinc-ribbon domain-containing protein, partial [Ligilactobacillus salivarius]